MLLRQYAIRILLAGLLLAGCNGHDDKPENTPAPTSVQQDGVSIRPSQTSFPTRTSVPPTPTIIIEPGPYFTPQRQPPDDPSNFAPPEQVEGFSRIQLTGNCRQSSGLLAVYRNEQQQVIYLQCQFLPDAEHARQALADVPAVLSEPPISYVLQGAESFLLGKTGDGFVYAWTHGAWYFLARTPTGRAPLDAFMAAFPY